LEGYWLKQYDLAVVGSGAGLMVLEEALSQGLRCALIEESKLGGTCLTKGCIPSKMLVYPADFIREAQHSRRFGVEVGTPSIDWNTISTRMWEQIDFHQTIEENLKQTANLTLYKGRGSFTAPDRMVIRYPDGRPEETICAEKFVIAAGARSFVPSIPGLEETGYLTSEGFFGPDFPQAPWESLVIVGSGAISAEFAHIFSAFGTKVTIIARSGRILSKEEEEISRFVARQFEKNGIQVLTDTLPVKAHQEGKTKYLTANNRITGEQTTIPCQEILIASGVQSNADTLSLEKAGVATDDQGWIPTNLYLETSQKNIWALGDINGKYQFRHKANHEAQILMENLFSGGEKKEVNYHSVPWTIFTHPQVSRVGMTEADLREKGIPYKVAKNYYSEVVGGRAMGYREEDDDNGFVKMLVGQNKNILGVHIVGPQSSVLLQPFVYLMNAGYRCRKKLEKTTCAKEIEGLRILCPHLGSYAPINDSMIIHPSLNELTAWVFEKLGKS
jgi:mycothione reductase